MDFKERLALQLRLELKFRNLIKASNWPHKNTRKYLSALNSHVMNACFYNKQLMILYPFSFFSLDWPLIHWKKRPFIPFIYLWQHLKFFANRR